MKLKIFTIFEKFLRSTEIKYHNDSPSSRDFPSSSRILDEFIPKLG